jgi:hypothetical protein
MKPSTFSLGWPDQCGTEGNRQCQDQSAVPYGEPGDFLLPLLQCTELPKRMVRKSEALEEDFLCAHSSNASVGQHKCFAMPPDS